jgi:WD40 repeat protein
LPALAYERVAFWDDITPKRVAWLPDGRTLAVGSTGIFLYDVQSGKQTRHLKVGMEWVEDVACSPDGKLLLAATQEGAHVWDLARGTLRQRLAGTTGAHAVAFSADGITFAVGIDKAVKTYRSADGEEILTFVGAQEEVEALAFSPDGRALAGAGRNVVLWDPATGQVAYQLLTSVIRANDVAISPDSRLLASTTLDSGVRLWDLTSSPPRLRTLRGHTGQVGAVSFSPDGALLASTSWDLTVRLWDTTSGLERAAIKGHITWIDEVAFSPDGKLLATAAGEGVRIWRLSSSERAPVVRRPAARPIAPVSVTPSPQAITAASAPRLAQAGYWEKSKAMSLAWSPRRDVIAVGGTGVYLYDGKTRRQIRTLELMSWIQDVAFSPDGAQIAGATTDGARLWETSGGTAKPIPGTKRSKAIAWSPDGTLIAVGLGQVVKLFDAAGPTELETLVAAQQSVEAVAFSPDGKLLASGAPMVTVWDVATGRSIRTLPGTQHSAKSLAFSPDGKTLAAAYDDRRVILWDASTGRELWVRQHAGQVTGVDFAPSGELIATASTDLTVRIWEAATGREAHVVKGHAFAPYDAVFSPDVGALVSAGMDGMRLWTIGR